MIPNAHITVYNKYIDPETRAEAYKRSEVYNVVWQGVRAISRMKEQVPANSTLILIPFASGTGYETPKVWQDGRDGWTLQEGDTIVRGMVTDDITTEYTLTSLRAKHENVVVISSIAAMDEGSPNVQHWEVNCK
jgi:hypothetical protein